MSLSVITHQGFVHSTEKGVVRIKIISMSACASCQVKGVCTASESEEKIIDVPTDKNYKIGEEITISSKTANGFKALWLAYVLPFLLVLFTLIILTSLKYSETKAGVFSLSMLIPYYFLLYLFRDKLKKKFTFEILK